MTSIDHLHIECKIMPNKEHLQLLCSQFLGYAKRAGHVSHEVIEMRPRRRNQCQTLQDRFGVAVEPFLVDGVMFAWRIPKLDPVAFSRRC